MNSTVWRLVGASWLVVAAAPVAAAGTAKVDFQNPETFTDINERQFRTPPEKNNNLQQLKSWLEKRAGRQLAPGQQLHITFLDIDLAGAHEPWQSVQLQDTRIVKELYPPRVKLHFTLTDATGAVLKDGERELRDLGFLMHAGPAGSDALMHDKAMLERWLKMEFSASP